MTKQECAIIQAYTGVCMLSGDDDVIFGEYVRKLLGRSLFTHEYLDFADRIKELSKPDFLKLCEFAVSSDQEQKLWEAAKMVAERFGSAITVPDFIKAFIDWHDSKAASEKCVKAILLTNMDAEKWQDLKDRDTAQKVHVKPGGVPVCPVCGATALKHYTFCPDCGQRLDQ